MCASACAPPCSRGRSCSSTTSASIMARPSASTSRQRAAACASCLPTRPTSPRLSRPLPKSRGAPRRRRAHPGGPRDRDCRRSRRSHGRRCARLVLPLRLRLRGSIRLKTALETLRRTLEEAGAGHGQVVALVGEPGVGKSRLVWEFGHSHRAQDWLVLEAGSVSYGKATSYLPVIDLLKSYCGVEARDDAQRIREKLTGKVLTLDPALQPTLVALLALLDVPVDDLAWAAL